MTPLSQNLARIFRFKPTRLRSQLVCYCVAIVALALLLSFVALAVFRSVAAKQSMRADLEQIAQIAGNESAAAVQFDEPLSAREIVDRLGLNPNLREVTLLTPENLPFATFQRNLKRQSQAAKFAEGEFQFSKNTLEVRLPIVVDEVPAGSIYVNSSLAPMHRELRQSLLIAGLITAVSLGLAVWLLLAVLGKKLRPIESLSRAAMAVAEDQDYSRRVETRAGAELDELAASFNHMLGTIECQQTRLIGAERMESIGLIASGVAHDLNNILGPVVGYPGLILQQMDEADPNRGHIQTIQECAVKAGGVLQGLLSLARRGNYSTEPVEANRVLEHMVESPGLQTRLAKYPKTRLKTNFAPNLPLVQGADSQLTQATLNLAINAVEAMGEAGGTLTISSRVFEQNADPSSKIPPGAYVEISISDEGCGIPQDKLKEIFKPFASSKPMAESGTGLGLAVVANVVHDHQGHVEVESEVGRGSTFRILLPIDENAKLEQHEPGEVRGNAENVLVVDDFEPQRDMIVNVLGNLGYQATSAASGTEALQMFPNGDYDLVVLDMKMEENFDGLDTFRALRVLDPTLPCLIVTGDADSDRVKEAIRLGAFDCVSKPFSVDRFSRRVFGALHEERRIAA